MEKKITNNNNISHIIIGTEKEQQTQEDERRNKKRTTFQTPDTRHIIKLSNYLGHENDTVNNIQLNWAAIIYRLFISVFWMAVTVSVALKSTPTLHNDFNDFISTQFYRLLWWSNCKHSTYWKDPVSTPRASVIEYRRNVCLICNCIRVKIRDMRLDYVIVSTHHRERKWRLSRYKYLMY